MTRLPAISRRTLFSRMLRIPGRIARDVACSRSLERGFAEVTDVSADEVFPAPSSGESSILFRADSRLRADPCLTAEDQAGLDREVRETTEALAVRVFAGEYRISSRWGVRFALPWHLDVRSGHSFPSWLPSCLTLPCARTYAQGSDVKYPRELSRFGFMCPLILGWRLGSPSAQKVPHLLRSLVLDWIERNPVGYGPNWECAMDAGMRIANWAVLVDALRGTGRLDYEFLRRLYVAAHQHGSWIATHLERREGVIPSNHYIGDLIGLLYTGAVFDRLRDGTAWVEFAREELVREAERQFYGDGLSHEASLGYHRLVLEFYIMSAIILERIGSPFPAPTLARLKVVAEALSAFCDDRGECVQIGDTDSGCLHPFSLERQSCSGLLNLAALAFGTPQIARAGHRGRLDVAAFFGEQGLRRLQRVRSGIAKLPPRQVNLRSFPQGGWVACQTPDGTLLTFVAGPNGRGGRGGHNHNDKLSLCLSVAGETVLTDPGSFAYTSDPSARDAFRGTGSHTTVLVDGQEQNRFIPGALFVMEEDSRAEILRAQAGAMSIDLEGVHHGYERLPAPVTHHRVIHLDASLCRIDVVDRFSGPRAAHRLTFSVVLHPSISCTQEGNTFVLSSPRCEGIAQIAFPDDLYCRQEEIRYSPGYGRCTETTALRGDFEGLIPKETTWVIAWTAADSQ